MRTVGPLSKPPSSDGYSKPSPKKRSLRERSGRKPGGQHGHEGAHLERVEVPYCVIIHEPDVCEDCGRDLADGEELEGGESRQGFRYPREARAGSDRASRESPALQCLWARE